MNRSIRGAGTLACAFTILIGGGCASTQHDPLPSWNDGPSKFAITGFVQRVTTEDTPDFVPPAERIAVFDNDGTLWSEHPAYFQLLFAIDRVKELAPQHPDWHTTQPFRAALEGDLHAVAESGEEGLLELVLATHAGMTTDSTEKVPFPGVGALAGRQRHL